MASTSIGFRWLDLLEKEFDKACIELDTSIAELDPDEAELVQVARQKIATLGSCFSQLTHKALTIFQHSAKLEAELVDMRAELVQARATLGAEAGGAPQAEAGAAAAAAGARAEAAQLARENERLRDALLVMHSDLFGARLATKYLDKELAGRIQQLQLLGREMKPELRESLSQQVEAEILLQRHKTLVRVCRGPGGGAGGAGAGAPAAGERRVRVRRLPCQGLGVSVTGGREHGVPILISELEADGPAARTGRLHVGDAILAIDDVDLTQASHAAGVAALQAVRGDCELRVQFVAADDVSLSEDTCSHYRYPLYPWDAEAAAGGGVTPTAPRTPDYLHRPSSAGSGDSHYPDYNTLNNNPAILDMSDRRIAVEAPRPPRAPAPAPAAQYAPAPAAQYAPAPAAQYRAAPVRSSSADSPLSTPVHRPGLKKKRKPADWKLKGAYRPVDGDSSDGGRPAPPEEPPRAVNGVKKGFRLGSARRVEPDGRAVAGDGDPDFGTPV